MGVQKDEGYNGKFKISVISTGIDSENYYKNVINNENIKEIKSHENEIKENDEISKPTNNQLEINQASFLVDLRHPNKLEQENDLKAEEKILKDEHPDKDDSEKKSFFEKLFGNKKNETNTKQNDDETSKEDFINEIKEISKEQGPSLEMNQKIVIEDENVRFTNENNYENNDINEGDSQNDVNDDLLQIPAFLRRQVN
jgi:molybdopterin converting factor small subunit